MTGEHELRYEVVAGGTRVVLRGPVQPHGSVPLHGPQGPVAPQAFATPDGLVFTITTLGVLCIIFKESSVQVNLTSVEAAQLRAWIRDVQSYECW